MLGLARLLPVAWRARVVGRFVRHVVGPAAGWTARATDNLTLIHPDWPEARRRAVAARCLENFGRTLIETLDPATMQHSVADIRLGGDGWDAVAAARAEGRPILFVTGHFGNAVAPRVALAAQGLSVGVVVRPLDDAGLNQIYVDSLTSQAGPVFPKGARGTAAFARHLRAGGAAVLLFDVRDARGEPIDFLGRPALTTLAPAVLARRSGAIMVPWFARRIDGWRRLELTVDRPIPDGEPLAMMQEATRRLERRIAADPDQWFWVHRRWRGAPPGPEAGGPAAR